ncbi:LysE family translocator [Agrobacterium sp. SHOUNA12C]|uniref:Amino acid efflux protein n=1 Tax=Rhizobium rhizogenes NBRC 13257 TaxID=1220581 RepID=A0AA87U2B0_RHIRH|nr:MULTISPECIES: LysE family translocator [Rhizobium]KAA6491288.1 LysE family translocator [Agrobacterium sp. ICMP 7243]MCJ9722873.1 LysE family translocator [Agrobacterium sp. BETTINA12B]MCJ9760548.1 LysE family translocator [Agrobacterium sp. SHOUNA12C]OCJ02906.1 threonine transporter RhtB [Agrobacterium sp. 13-626]OCJ24989.1 threonine transporter RhtB [Agrobacterium sp. B131/95]OCJ31859.1 threonine transporter RhtB [Agrobacterium sp. B133/95]
MGYTENLWLFFLLLFGIIIVPGMDMLFVLANSLTGGRNRGLAATGGIMLGGAVHSLNGALGVGLLMHFVPVLFNPLLLAGAGYMAFIGITLMRSSITVGDQGPAGSRSAWKAFRQGAVTCLINPKAYLFILAVYPQFLKPDYGPIWIQATIMGLMTVATQFLIYGGLAVTAGRSRDLLVANPVATAFAGRAAGLLLFAVSVFTVWEGWRTA